MRVTVVSWTYRHGSRHFASSEVDTLRSKGLLYRLITPYEVYDGNMKLVKPRGKFLCRILYIIQRSLLCISKCFDARLCGEYTFDVFASMNIGSPDIVFLDKNTFPMVTKRATQKGILAITYQAIPHYDHIEALLVEEQKKFSIRSDKFLDFRANERRKKGLMEADSIIACSHLVKETDVRHGIEPDKIRIVYGGVDVDNFSYCSKPENKFQVLFVGHGALLKGLFYLLEAWNSLYLDEGSELVVAGQLPNEIKYKYKKKNIKFLGNVKNTKNLYQKACVVVCPSLADAGPKVVYEAMASGCPVIISEGVGQSSIITHGKEGYICPIKDSSSIAEAIRYFYDNREQINIMGRAARELSEKYSLKNHADLLVETVVRLGLENQEKDERDYLMGRDGELYPERGNEFKDSFSRLMATIRYRWAIKMLREHGSKRVLEFGCGLGYGTNMIYKAGFEVTGIDCSKETIQIARRLYPHIEFDVANSETYESEKRYDAVVALEHLEHLERYELAVAAWRRLLRPDGLLLISTPNAELTSGRNPHHYKEFTYGELQQMFPNAVISGTKVVPFHGMYRILRKNKYAIGWVMWKCERFLAFKPKGCKIFLIRESCSHITQE